MRQNTRAGDCKRLLIAIALAMMMLAVMSASASALGITPSRTILQYEPGLTKDIDMLVINNEHKDMKLGIYLQGDLADYVTMKQTLIQVSASDDSKPISISLALPENLTDSLTPGEHNIDVVIIELYDQQQLGNGASVITSKTAIMSQIKVDVPYPGKYIESQLHAADTNTGEAVRFVMPVFNLGSENIDKLKATVRIYGPTNNELGSVDTDEISLDSKKQADLKAEWVADVDSGTYHAKADIYYDNKKLTVESDFTVGTPDLMIKDLTVDNFVLGEIAKFNIHLFNNWNDVMSHVYADMTIKDSTSKIVAQTKTSEISIDPYSDGFLNAYWDTAGTLVGDYDTIITIHGNNKASDRMFKIQVFPNSLEVSKLTGFTLAQRNTFVKDAMLAIAVIMLIALNIYVISTLRKSKSGGSASRSTTSSSGSSEGNSSKQQNTQNSLAMFGVTRKAPEYKESEHDSAGVSERKDTGIAMNDRLYSYIKHTLEKGVSEQKLIAHLRNVGWNDKIIRFHLDKARDEKLGLKDE